MPHPQIYQADPFRPVNWREERVIGLIEAEGGPKRASKKFDDKYVRQYRNFLFRWRTKTSPEEKQLMFPKYPELYHAQRIRENDDQEFQAVMQARILSGASNVEIAEAQSTAPAVVRWYEKMFFDVRERLSSRDYIRNVVLIPAIRESVSFDDREILTADKKQAICKMLAYVGGPKVLDFALMGFERSDAPTRLTQLTDWMDTSFTNSVRHASMLGMQAFNFNKFSIMQLFEMCRQIVESAAEARRAGGTVTEFHSNVDKLLTQINLQIGSKSETGVDGKVEAWENGQVELSSSDYLTLSAGETPEDLKVFEGFQRPEPTPKEI
jgi:hypothetical protein